MDKNRNTYRTEGSAALQPESISDNTSARIISFETVKEYQGGVPSRTGLIDQFKLAVKSDPLFGSLPYASSKKVNTTYTDRCVFLIGTTLASVFGLLIILIGA